MADGPDERQGRIEVCNNNAWGTVCDDLFGTTDATVACIQAGFNGVGESLALNSSVVYINCSFSSWVTCIHTVYIHAMFSLVHLHTCNLT